MTELSGDLGYSTLLDGASDLRLIQPGGLRGYAVLRNPDGSVESARASYDARLQWNSRMGVGVGADLRVEAEWNPSRFVGLSGTYGVDAVRFPARDQGFDAHVARVRLRAAANTHTSPARPSCSTTASPTG